MNIQVDREYVEIYPVNWEPLTENSVRKIFSTRSYELAREINLYVHIPFCPKICPFCTFNTMRFVKDTYLAYVEALKKEILHFENHPDFKDREITAIYFGGGTGSILFAEDAFELLKLIKNHFPVNQEVEITMECYPTTVDYQRLLEYKDLGINRISIGIQSFDERNLRIIGRFDTYSYNKEVILHAKNIGFKKIAVDLMYRFPSQNIYSLVRDLEIVTELKVDNISTYSLEVEKTPFEKIVDSMPSDEEDKNMFYLIGDFLEERGYKRFAQPDFTVPGKEYRYLINIWKAPQQLVLGLGAGAHTHYFGGHVWANIYNVEKYIELLKKGYLTCTVGSFVSIDELMHKYCVLGVRCLELDKTLFRNFFGLSIEEAFAYQLEELINLGWIEDNGNQFTVTKKGLWYIDNISKKFYSSYNKDKKQPWGKNLNGFIPCRFPRI